jgi:hypothetical protein
MKKIFLCLFFVVSLQACKGPVFYSETYVRADRKSRFILDVYSVKDQMNIYQTGISLIVNPANRLSTSSEISFSKDSIDRSVKKALSGIFTNSRLCCEQSLDFGQDYNSKDEVLRFNLLNESDLCRCEQMVLIPQLRITSKSIKSVDFGAGLVYDTGDDKHLLEYKLVTSIYRNDSLIYMDNRTHWTEVISARGEQLQYQVPQEVIDTLVKLSLEEYFKRMK